METKQNSLGLNIPAQTLKSSSKLEMTPSAVMTWRNRLPMADTGATANQVYHALSDCNKVTLPIADRFQILDLFRTPVQFICQSLRKHYLNQTEALTDKKLTIVKLAQTLQIEMANGYKIIVTELAEKEGSEEYKNMMTASLMHILHYFSYILLRNYHLYSLAPKGLWQEFYKLYQYAENKRLLGNIELLDGFKHILIVSATDPYKWRQAEQDAIFNVSSVWSSFTNIIEGSKSESPGLYVFELTEDSHPMSHVESNIKDPKNCRILDVNNLVKHLKSLLAIVEPNELQARIAHGNDPEYAISLPVLQGIIQEWAKVPKRDSLRIDKTANIRAVIGLSAIHYFLSGEKPFMPQSEGEAGGALQGLLPTLSIQEEVKETQEVKETTESSQEVDMGTLSVAAEIPKKSTAFPIYSTKELNESENGYCLIWSESAYPPLQAGELIGLSIVEQNGNSPWIVGMVRWLKHDQSNELKIGVRLLAKTAEAAAAQILKEGKGAGYYLRCLILDTGILTPTLPFKPGSNILIMRESSELQEVELFKLRSATGSYKLFDYKSKEKVVGAEPTHEAIEKTEASKSASKGSDPFDSIWSNL